MDRQGNNRTDRQRGAALLIVLLLVATLSFVALSATEKTSVAAARAFNERTRSENLWRAFGAETLAVAAIRTAIEARPETLSIDDPWILEPLIIPIDDATAQINFSDATTCFNVNSLSGTQVPGTDPPSKSEFVLLVRNLGLGDFEGQQIADVITDWIDDNSSRQIQGAEDNYYTALPSPYRTGGQAMASVTELRALNGFSAELYNSLKPYLCAQNQATGSPVNVNMLVPGHAPLLAAMLGANVSPGQANDLIRARPPGGYGTVQEFLEPAASIGVDPASIDAGRFSVSSRYLKARAEIIYDTAVLELTSTVEIGTGGDARVIRRRIGTE